MGAIDLGSVLGRMAHRLRQTADPALREIREAFHAGGETPSPPSYWADLPRVARALRARICGEDERYPDYAAYTIQRWGNKLPRAGLRVLCLGPGEERDLAALFLATGRVERVVVTVDAGTRPGPDPEEARIERVPADLDRDALPGGPFHVVAADGTFSRVAEQEWLLDQVNAVLDFGGLFVCRDYVGPNRLQFGAVQMGFVNALLAGLPESLRRTPDGAVREAQSPPDLGWLMALDPTVAVRSEDVPGIVRGKLTLLEEIELGGAVLAPLLAGIGQNFAAGGEEADRTLDALMDIEMALMRAGMIDSDYAFLVARRPR